MKMRFSINIVTGFYLLVCGSSININVITTGNRTMYNTHDYGVDVKKISSILFRVKGCMDGRINLFDGPDFSTAKSAIVLLGGWDNRKCLMAPCSGCSTTYSPWYPFLDCNEMRPMWINWTGRLLSVGHGEYVGEQMFIFTDEQRDFDVQYLAVGSSYNHVFDWEFDDKPGNFFERVVPNGWSTRQMLSSLTSNSRFKCIKSCQGRISCRSISYQSTTNICQLYFERSRSVDIDPDNTWETWIEINV
ncbi:C3 and PZP-like alpha-2-macroglobulin domain-containing protein 8 [Haliotis rufescens]|uniref:C3 and PZP-like alpha-2-macroglobulin domain-containing protein 8 n=1 Tax=Haliotis rufescens TaxID=6454 RepID=UPI00201F90DD|nr:C3 and PZP-like alpha-2-macroglobulin domain-containing protein 8 [Haliotis rufescens]